jgi:hypothetical protein
LLQALAGDVDEQKDRVEFYVAAATTRLFGVLTGRLGNEMNRPGESRMR